MVEFDVGNYHLVCVQPGTCGSRYGIMNPPSEWMSHFEALRLAAWLVALADPGGALDVVEPAPRAEPSRFAQILLAVLNT